ncbi:MAG: ABC transporter ATP-binding protein [Tannerella sp.]|jgi:zinc transport system ATP-binding protein|nr:ABC transporter ATP-binding protein [Tannerella sp.]
MNKLIELNNVSVSYDTKVVLRDVSFKLWTNDFLGIIGPNGGGKTTLIKVILGLLKPGSGMISFYDSGRETSSLKTGYLPQINQIDKHFPISVYEVVASGLMSDKKRLGGYTAIQRNQIRDTIEQMGLDGLSERPIGELSGGELQRTLLGRAVVSSPQVLILDEPNTYVDKLFESRLYELLKIINEQTAIILVSHDVGTILPLVKNVACVNETLHYHAGNNITEGWLDEAFHCPIELVGHGDIPHRVLKTHNCKHEH